MSYLKKVLFLFCFETLFDLSNKFINYPATKLNFTQFTFLRNSKWFQFQFHFVFVFVSDFFLTRLPPSERDYPVDPLLQLRHDLMFWTDLRFWVPTLLWVGHLYTYVKRARWFFKKRISDFKEYFIALKNKVINFKGNI